MGHGEGASYLWHSGRLADQPQRQLRQARTWTLPKQVRPTPQIFEGDFHPSLHDSIAACDFKLPVRYRRG